MGEACQGSEIHDEYPKENNWNSNPCIENFCSFTFCLKRLALIFGTTQHDVSEQNYELVHSP